MRLGKKVPPYPILNKSKNVSSYVNSDFSFQYDLEETNELLKIKNVKIDTNNVGMTKLFDENKLQAIIIIECSSTIYREEFKISFVPISIEIPMKNINGKVEISCFAYATEDIENYYDEDMNQLYKGYSFNIEKYTIFAVDDGFTMKIEHDDKEDNKVSSIFSIIKSYDKCLNSMKVELTEKKIKISLPEKAFDYYDSLKDKENFQNIFFSIIVIPTLTSALNEIQKFPNGTDIDDIVDKYSWFKSIVNSYKKNHNTELDYDTIKQLEPLDLAQDLMNSCTVNSFEDFYKTVTNIVPNETRDEDE